jgi:hypothetical protein
MRCPTQGWLAEMNSQILVGIDVLGNMNTLPWGGELAYLAQRRDN